uniref:Secreted protein n=1 Tax=Cacopsylla melanoneura TaxID=428564 RepID=A0A8D9B6N2_9HEMI
MQTFSIRLVCLFEMTLVQMQVMQMFHVFDFVNTRRFRFPIEHGNVVLPEPNSRVVLLVCPFFRFIMKYTLVSRQAQIKQVPFFSVVFMFGICGDPFVFGFHVLHVQNQWFHYRRYSAAVRFNYIVQGPLEAQLVPVVFDSVRDVFVCQIRTPIEHVVDNDNGVVGFKTGAFGFMFCRLHHPNFF